MRDIGGFTGENVRLAEPDKACKFIIRVMIDLAGWNPWQTYVGCAPSVIKRFTDYTVEIKDSR